MVIQAVDRSEGSKDLAIHGGSRVVEHRQGRILTSVAVHIVVRDQEWMVEGEVIVVTFITWKFIRI